MLVIGLTGSIGMGKSTAAARFRFHGIAVFDADAEVHRLYDGPLAAEIDAAFPGTASSDGKVDRAKLSAALLKAPERFKDLEHIVHPRVYDAERRFLRAEAERGAAMAVLEIPLLLEKNRDVHVDFVVVVSTHPDVQRRRVLQRPGMTDEKLDAILARQVANEDKQKRAHFVVDTSGDIESSNAQVDAIIAKLSSVAGKAFDRYWRI